MASRKPLVLNGGTIEQLQSGDTLDAVASEVEVISSTADASLAIGDSVYATTAAHCNKAQSNALGTTVVIGISKSTGTAVVIQTSGVVALTTAQWDTAFGTTGGLTVGTTYFLSDAAAGKGVATAPSTAGSFVVELGTALSTTQLLLRVKRPIKL